MFLRTGVFSVSSHPKDPSHNVTSSSEGFVVRSSTWFSFFVSSSSVSSSPVMGGSVCVFSGRARNWEEV